MRNPNVKVVAKDAAPGDGIDSSVHKVYGYELRGANWEAFCSKEPECILAGPRDTGKTVAMCLRYHYLCQNIKDGQFAILRKVRATLSGTVLRTFFKVAPSGYRVFGGDNPTKLVYPSGSVIWLGGMDDPGKTLSSERDGIYINQSEELTLDDWEVLSGATSGRSGNVEFPQLSGDANPGGSRHWIKERAKALDQDGKPKLRLLSVMHKDNPSLYDRNGVLTEGGKKRIAVLENLTGVRRKRLFEGLWATMEGAVFDTFDSLGGVHVRVRKPEEMKRWFLCQDKGYTQPAVILLVGADEDDRWHVFREFYRSGVLQTDVVRIAQGWFRNPMAVARCETPMTYEEVFAACKQSCEIDAVDAAAADLIAELVDAGVNAVGGKGRVQNGITLIQNRLKILGDGKSRLSVDPSCGSTINDMESYAYKPDKDEPEKEFDHSCDSLRYLADVLGEGTGGAGDEHRGQIYTGDPSPFGHTPFGHTNFTPRQFTPRQWRIKGGPR